MQHAESPGRQGVEHGATSRIDRLRETAQYDLPASLVVFLVALPLSLGIAIASDAPVLAGLIAAIVGGIVAGWIGGSPLQVSGPAAGLTVIVADVIHQFGWAITCFITVIAGILQVVLGLSRIARAALAISPVVVHAMLAGIGSRLPCSKCTYCWAAPRKARHGAMSRGCLRRFSAPTGRDWCWGYW